MHIGHFTIVADRGHPVVLPTAVVRDGDWVLAHGSTGSGRLRRLAAGAPTCLAVTAFDALLVARSAFESSMRYRSAVLFGAGKMPQITHGDLRAACRTASCPDSAAGSCWPRRLPGRSRLPGTETTAFSLSDAKGAGKPDRKTSA